MKAEHALTDLCAACAVKRSGYHAWAQAPASQRERTDAVLLAQIRTVHPQHRSRYGAPRIQAELATPPAPTGPNQTWVTDLTYVRTVEGWLYVAVRLDLWSRKVVGWATGESLHAALARRALTMSLQHRRPPSGLLQHSDRGGQYASAEYRELLRAAGLTPSMSRAGNPYDNAAMESFNATYKRECVGLAEKQGGYATRAEATADFFDYVEKYYNRERRHSALGYKSPVDFENQLN